MMAHFRIPPRPPMVERVRPTTMGDLQHFCLRWNNYQNSITTAFENLRDDEDFIDVTLACDGKTLKAHRVVLSACSPYFRELLKSTPCKHPVIVLQDVVFDDLHALVEFIYHGEVNVHQRNLTSFLKTAEILKVSGLTQQNAAAPSTPASSASPSSDHYNDNLSTRFTTRSPSTPPDKTNLFQPPLYSSTHQLNNSNEDRNSPRTLQQQIRHRRHIRSPTPIRSPYARDDSPVLLKRAKSADNASPILNCSTNVSPTTEIGDETIPTIRTRKNSCDGSSSSRRNSPSNISNNNNYDENHNDENPAATIGREDDDEPPVDFSTSTTKKYAHNSGPYSSSKNASPKNLSMKSEPMDLVSNHNNNNENDNENNNQFNDDDSSQWEDRLSDQSPPTTNPYPPSLLDHEDAFQGHHRSYLDSKIFAAAGASFSFNMAAAALAADSLAGFNHHHQGHTNLATNAVIDSFSGSSPGLLLPPPPITGNINEPQDCPHCHRTFSCYYSLKRHFQDKHEHRNTLYVCEFCHRRYRTKNSLTTHKSLQHRGSAGMLKRLIRSTSSHFSQPFAPQFQSTSLLFESIMYNNNSV